MKWNCNSSTVPFEWVAILTFCVQPWAYHRIWQLHEEHFALLTRVSQQEMARLKKNILAWVWELGCTCMWIENVVWNMFLGKVDSWNFVALNWLCVHCRVGLRIHLQTCWVSNWRLTLKETCLFGENAFWELGKLEFVTCRIHWCYFERHTCENHFERHTFEKHFERHTCENHFERYTLRNTLRDTLVKTTLRDTLVRATLRDTLVRATVWAMLKFRYHMFNHPFGSHFSFPPLSLPNLPPSAIASAQSKFQMLSKSPQVHSGALSLHSNPLDQVPTSAHNSHKCPIPTVLLFWCHERLQNITRTKLKHL